MKCIIGGILVGGGKSGKVVKRVPCGQCVACRLNHARMWSIRCMHESKSYVNNIFLTLTYNNDNLPNGGTLVKSDLQKFFKRLRKHKKFRYYACGEYGDESKRPHYHAIMFGLSSDDLKLIQDCWQYGFVYIGDVTVDSCNYVASYVVKKQRGKKAVEYYENLGIEPEFAVMSRNPGIGKKFAEKNLDNMLNRGYVTAKGVKYSVPQYYKNMKPRDIITDFVDGIANIKKNEQVYLDKKKERGYTDEEMSNYDLQLIKQKNLNIESKQKLKKGVL